MADNTINPLTENLAIALRDIGEWIDDYVDTDIPGAIFHRNKIREVLAGYSHPIPHRED